MLNYFPSMMQCAFPCAWWNMGCLSMVSFYCIGVELVTYLIFHFGFFGIRRFLVSSGGRDRNNLFFKYLTSLLPCWVFCYTSIQRFLLKYGCLQPKQEHQKIPVIGQSPSWLSIIWVLVLVNERTFLPFCQPHQFIWQIPCTKVKSYKCIEQQLL